MRTLSVTSTLVFMALAAGAQQTLHVPVDYPTIRSAVGAASNGDTVLVAPGTYREGNYVDFAGKIISVRSTDGPEATIIDGEGDVRCVRFTGAETRDTLLEGFTLLNGQAPDWGGTIGDSGGAVLIQNGSPTIRNCWIVDGRADFGESGGSPGHRGGHGGGMQITNSSPLIENCRFIGNHAGVGGGGASGSTGSSGSLFSSPGSGGDGEDGGRGGHGGAIHLSGGSPVFVNCFFSGNRSGRGGNGGNGGRGGHAGTWAGRGGNGGDGGDAGDAGEGGAIHVSSGTIDLRNCTLTGHLASQPGSWGFGGSGGSSALGNGSSGDSGDPGLWTGWLGVSASSGAVHNSIVWNSGSAGDVSPGLTVTYSCVRGGYNGGGNIGSHPLTQGSDGALTSGSPCIDAGDNAQVPRDLLSDLDGRPRFVDNPVMPDTGLGAGALVDMGATEFVSDYVLPYGCGNPTDSLVVTEGAPRMGSSMTLSLHRSGAPRMNGDFPTIPRAARTALIIGSAPLETGCGVQLPGGFLQVDLSQSWMRQWGGAWTGEPVEMELSLPADPALLGTSLFVQGAFVHLSPNGETGGGMRLTESLELVVGP